MRNPRYLANHPSTTLVISVLPQRCLGLQYSSVLVLDSSILAIGQIGKSLGYFHF